MEQITNRFFDLPAYRDFVRPELSKQLALAGLHPHTMFKWKVSKKEIRLHTSAFDIDNYYASAWQYIDGINSYEQTPAYTAGDCMRILSVAGIDYNIIKRDAHFHVFLNETSKLFISEPLHGDRFPDVLAALIQNLIVSGYISLENINQVFTVNQFVNQ